MHERMLSPSAAAPGGHGVMPEGIATKGTPNNWAGELTRLPLSLRRFSLALGVGLLPVVLHARII